MALGPQFQQLQMLMTGSEIQNILTKSNDAQWNWDEQRKETMGDLWNRKETEARQPSVTGAHGAGVYESLNRQGYRGDTLNIRHGHLSSEDGSSNNYSWISDGHHRVAAAAALEREGKTMFIPVEHTDTDYDPRKGKFPLPLPPQRRTT